MLSSAFYEGIHRINPVLSGAVCGRNIRIYYADMRSAFPLKIDFRQLNLQRISIQTGNFFCLFNTDPVVLSGSNSHSRRWLRG